MKRYLPFAIILAVAAAALCAGTMLYQAKKETVFAPIPGELSSANPGAKPPHFRGSAKATVVLEEFADFQCPPCATTAVYLKKLGNEFPEKLRIVFRQFPLAMHNHAVEAARAAEAAAAQDRFWEMNELLYEKQNDWATATDVQPLFEEYAKTIGLDLTRFKADQEKNELLGRIGMDNQRGTSMGVTGTPTLFLNNQRVPQQFSNEAGLREAINAALNGKSPFPTPSPSPTLTPTPTSTSTPIS
jgi:protein-disulfide isomerase